MTVHSYHPDLHENGLADDCPRCAELAEHPFQGLDTRNLTALLRRVEMDEYPRSDAEAKAMKKITEALYLLNRIGELREP
jgi:hypothetical protein